MSRWVVEAPSFFSKDAVEKLRSEGFLFQLSFAIEPRVFHHLLEDSGLLESLQGKLARVDLSNPDSVMLACFSSRQEIVKLDFPAPLSLELEEAYQALSTQTGLEQALVTVRPFGSSFHEGGRYRGFGALCKAIATAYAEHLTRCVMQEKSTSLDHILATTPTFVVGQALGWSCSGSLSNFETNVGAEEFVTVLSTWGLAEDIARKELARDEYLVHKERLAKGFAPLVSQRAGNKEFRLDFDISAGRMRHSEVALERVRELTLTPQEALRLARVALLLEEPVELDWGMEEGWSRQIHLLGARRVTPPSPKPLRIYRITSHDQVLVQGTAVGSGVAVGKVRVIDDYGDLKDFVPGEILVTRKTEPDWEPFFRQAKAIVTERDTRVSHSTILARDLGIPALLQAEGSSLFLQTGQQVTVACCQGDIGYLYHGAAEFTVEEFDATHRPQLSSELMLNLSMPERAIAESRFPWAGAGLVRSEFIMSGWVRIHPLALCFPERLAPEVQGTVHRLCRGYASPKEYFIDKVSQAVATVASAFWPRPVILRLSDLKSHEYSKLVGGERFEPAESHPMLGFRGASRYTHPDYRPAFELELAALRKVRQTMGFHNLHLMVPFCRTPGEGEAVVELLAEAGLKQGEDGLEVWVMAELPSNVFLADEFAEIFDGFSIGSSDLTQLTLGVDRDNTRVKELFDELDPVLMLCYETLIEAAQRAGKRIGFCGQIASDDPMFAATLAEMGLDSISVTPDAFRATLSALRRTSNRLNS